MSLFWQGVVTTIAVEAVLSAIAIGCAVYSDSKKKK